MPTPNVFLEIDQLDPILSANVSDNDLLVLFDLDAPSSPRMRKLSIANARNLFGDGGGGAVDLSNYYTKPQTDTLVNAKAALVHAHVIDDVTGLTAALSGKAASVHTHAIADVTNLQTELNNRVTNAVLTAGLANKADVVHGHVIADVSGLQTDLNSRATTTSLTNGLAGKADVSHIHTISNVTNLQTTLDAKASSVHTHAIADVTLLQDALDGKAATAHIHSIANVTGLQNLLNGKQLLSSRLTTLADTAIATTAKLPLFNTDGSVTFIEVPSGGSGGTTSYLRASTSTTVSINGSAFNTVILDTVNESVNITYNTTTGIATVNTAGYYLLQGTARVADNAPLYSYGLGIDTANVDTSFFLWTNTEQGLANDRNGLLNVRVAYLNAGAQIRLYTYIDSGGSHNVGASLTMFALNTGSSGGSVDLSNYYTKPEADTLLAGKAATSHTQAISTITDLQAELDNRATDAELTSGLAGKANTTHNHAIADVTNLQTTLDNKAASVHTHVIADVTGLTAALAGKSDTTHTHANATTAVAGFMSAADKVKLDGVQSLQFNKMTGFWNWLTSATMSTTQGLSGGTSGLVMYSFTTGTGSGLAANNSVDVTKPGVLVMSSGTTATGRAGASLASGNTLTSANFQQRIAANVTLTLDLYVRVPTLSSGTEGFRQFYGWSDSLTPSSGNMALIYIDENSNVIGMSCSAGSTSTQPLGVVTSNQWFRLRMTATNTLITYQFSNNTPATISTNISPNGMTFHTTALKTVGVTSRTVEIDYTYVDITYPAQF
jgi:hypothetical protein